ACENFSRLVDEIQVYQEKLESQNTELRRAQEELRAVGDHYAALYDHSPAGYVTLDGSGRIRNANLTLADMLGTRRESLLGSSLARLAEVGSGATLAGFVEAILATGERQVCDLPLRREDGSGFVGMLEGVIERGGAALSEPGRVLVHVSDITGRKRMEAELRESRKQAELANAAKSSFVANVSHEIRSPMNAIVGMTDILLSAEVAADDRKNYLGIIMDSALSMVEIINDILDISKIESGSFVLESVPFDLHGRVEEACEAMAFKAAQKGLELICRIPIALPTTVIGDPLRLRQVLVNLIGNAIKFTERGSVFVEVASASLSRVDPGIVSLRFSVTDTGIGIPADKCELVFEKFCQADASISRRFGGTGLGLSLCREMVHLMGGSIGLRSVEGEGSRFDFVLPLGVESGRALVEDRRGGSGGAGASPVRSIFRGSACWSATAIPMVGG
ncbi:MAG: PAS domain S-box protein, partial [Magnetococcales bacterium]|nr:PAS domain S-box protein [Magnetococcales bacterium]